MPLPLFQPMPLGRIREPFSHPNWLFEIKWGGLRCVAHVDGGVCSLVSQNGNEFRSFPVLNSAIPAELCARSAVLDGEVVCLDRQGKAQFRDPLFLRGEPRFYAFDLLWCDGHDLGGVPLVERKRRLHSVVAQGYSQWIARAE